MRLWQRRSGQGNMSSVGDKITHPIYIRRRRRENNDLYICNAPPWLRPPDWRRRWGKSTALRMLTLGFFLLHNLVPTFFVASPLPVCGVILSHPTPWPRSSFHHSLDRLSSLFPLLDASSSNHLSLLLAPSPYTTSLARSYTLSCVVSCLPHRRRLLFTHTQCFCSPRPSRLHALFFRTLPAHARPLLFGVSQSNRKRGALS
jgi:hypothetical protein